MKPGMLAETYVDRAHGLRLTDEAIDEHMGATLDEFWGHLEGYFPDIEEWPAAAQLGLLLMAWAMGPHVPKWHPNGWPHFTAACVAQDWLKAAAESEISGARPARNKEHRDLFLSAAVADDPEALEG
jgi:hypothetical protein